MNELTIISGKGGTGKTSIVSSFAALADNLVLADCDVDAADLHLILSPAIQRQETFKGGKRARIKPGHCVACDVCQEVCAFDAIFYDGPGNGMIETTFRVDPIACEGCGVCARVCQYNAIEFEEAANGQWFLSQTRFGPMVHAKLGIAEENSGKLVTLVRQEAAKLADQAGHSMILT
ncbi:(4Fe-4S)-binding protein, partial [bacterium]|nr:(4Fe-4S)-binding protein [bacterium]